MPTKISYASAATWVIKEQCMIAFQMYTCVLSQKAFHYICRQYDYGSNKVIPHTVQNGSDASSASGNPDTADKVSFSGGIHMLRALCTVCASGSVYIGTARTSCIAKQCRRLSFVNAWLGVFVYLQLLK
jgi:hypothetical protein